MTAESSARVELAAHRWRDSVHASIVIVMLASFFPLILAIHFTVWRDRARRQRYVSYAMAGLVGAIGFLMSTKPELW